MKRGTLLLALLGILVLGLVTGPGLWAAPGQSLERQTVPTRTPKPEPIDKPDKPDEPDELAESTSPPPTGQPTVAPTTPAEVTPVVPSTPAIASPAVGAPEQVLPEAGGRSVRLHLGVAMIVVALLVVVVIRRRA